MTILIVDDETSVLRYTSTIVRDVGYEILAADGGEEALALCKSHVIDLMISDVFMPRMNGRALAESKEIVAGLTARGFAHGYTYLQKPFRPEDLLSAIKAAFKIVAELKLAAAAA